MAKLMLLSEWRERNFIEPRPSLRTFQKWCSEGEIPGAKKIGNLWFVDIEINKKTTGNPLVDRVLNS